MKIIGRRLRRSFAGAAMAALIASPGMVSAETLTDALIDAYKNSNLLEQNRALLRIADDDVAVAFSNLLPTLNFITNWGGTHPNPGTTNVVTGETFYGDNLAAVFQLQAGIALYTGGQNRNNLEAKRETVLATREALRSLEQQVLLQAVSAYMGMLRSIAFVDLRENNVRVLGQELQATRDRFDVGEVTRTDVALAESRLAAANSELEAARGEYQVARENFKVAVGRYPGTLANPPALPKTAATVDEATQVAFRTHPDIRQAQRQVTVSEIGVKVAQGSYKPQVSASITSQTDSENQAESHSLNLQFTQPIYQGGSLAAFERQAKSSRDSSRANLHQVTLTVEQDVATAWANLEVAKAVIRSAELQIKAAQIAFDGTREEATLGARTTLDVLDAEQELLDAKASRIDALATQYVANYTLLSAMGLMTVDHLNLGIQTYDPAGYYNAVKHSPARLSPRGQQLDRVLEKLGKQ